MKKKPKQCVFYASPAGCIRGKSCPFLHQNDSVTKKPLPADPADVQRLKGKPQSAPKPANSGALSTAPGVSVPSTGATSSTTPAPTPQVSMVRVDRQQLEPEPEPIRRHPVAHWRPHDGPTRENHPKFLLPTAETMVPMSIHMAGQHFEHIVFGANQRACWLRCALCEKTSPRVLYRYTICMRCPGRRRDDDEPLWAISTRCTLVKWNCLLLRLFWMGTEDVRAYFTQEIRNLYRQQRFVEAEDSEVMEVFHEIIEPEHGIAQTHCDLRWAPPTRHAVLNEELTGLGLIPAAYRPTGPVPSHFSVRPEGNPSECPGTSRTSDDLRAEVNLLKTEQEDQLDETRSNEAHLRHVIHQQDPCNIQGPCPSKPFEGLEQCLPWHQRAWGRLTHGCSCHRRRILRSYNEDQPPSNTTTSRTQWLTYMQDIAFPISLRSSGRDSMRRVERTMNVPPYSAGMDMRPGATTSNVDRISETAHGEMSTWRNEREMTRISARLWDSSRVPSTYLASRPLLGRDGQDSEVIPGYRRRTAPRMTSRDPTIRRTSDHEDSRRLASGLPTNLSHTRAAIRRYPSEDTSDLGRQTDPGDRRTSDWRSSTLGNDPASPSTGRPMCGSPTSIGPSSGPCQQMQQDVGLQRPHDMPIETEGNAAGNASWILMTGLQRPGQRGLTMPIVAWLRPIIPNRLMMLLSGTDTRRNIGNPGARYNTWLGAELLQEDYPSEGYFMNTTGSRTGIGSWFRPNTALMKIPKSDELLSGTDTRRGISRKVTTSEYTRAREYTRRQVEQMDEWERAFYQEWTSLISRNALAFPYPMERESEAQTLIATPIRGYARGSASSTDLSVLASNDRPFRARNTNPLLRTMEGTLEDGTTTSESIQTTPASRNWNSANLRRSGIPRSYPGEQVTPERAGGPFPEGVTPSTRDSISFPYRMEGTLEDGTTTSGSTQTTIASRTRNSDTLPRGTVLRRDRRTGRTCDGNRRVHP